ncbi:hypothetical protein ACTD5D_35580 [Nocardia takedensis]|uniref:hypothetical protein n=1 Tax=Nocardia takedensis TaxID=259390 RepID=UPI0002EB63F0|nr:hypothetical protein [Nocardia takedensis]
MASATPEYRELVAAAFAQEVADGGLDEAALRRLREGEVREWTDALDRSGLFGKQAVSRLERRWREDPEDLLDAILSGADAVTERRWRQVWAGLRDRGLETGLG